MVFESAGAGAGAGADRYVLVWAVLYLVCRPVSCETSGSGCAHGRDRARGGRAGARSLKFTCNLV
jgi:hypothetical protein